MYLVLYWCKWYAFGLFRSSSRFLLEEVVAVAMIACG